MQTHTQESRSSRPRTQENGSGRVIPGPEAVSFRGPAGEFLWVEMVTITPDLARKYLTAIHTRQRRLNQASMRKLERAAAFSGFGFTGDTIKFDDAGYLCDGQHRLTAVVNTGECLTTLVLHGIRVDSFAELGETTKWNPGSHIRAEMPEITGNINSLVGAIQLINRWDGKTVTGSYGNTTAELSNAEVVRFLRDHMGLVEAQKIGAQVNRKVGVPPAVMAAIYYRLTEVQKAKADEFFDYLITGRNLDAGMATLRDRLMKMSEDTKQPGHSALVRWRIMAITIKAWNAWRDGRFLKVLKWDHTREEFPIPR